MVLKTGLSLLSLFSEFPINFFSGVCEMLIRGNNLKSMELFTADFKLEFSHFFLNPRQNIYKSKRKHDKVLFKYYVFRLTIKFDKKGV